jgi:hypothetical protein
MFREIVCPRVEVIYPCLDTILPRSNFINNEQTMPGIVPQGFRSARPPFRLMFAPIIATIWSCRLKNACMYFYRVSDGPFNAKSAAVDGRLHAFDDNPLPAF